jgi:hypothetical protein
MGSKIGCSPHIDVLIIGRGGWGKVSATALRCSFGLKTALRLWSFEEASPQGAPGYTEWTGGQPKPEIDKESVRGGGGFGMLGAEDFADFLGEVLEGKGFLQEGGAGAECALGDDGVFGVSGEIKNFDVGANG